MVSGGLSKARPEIQIHFSSAVEKRVRKYEDSFTEELPTLEDVKEKRIALWLKLAHGIGWHTGLFPVWRIW